MKRTVINYKKACAKYVDACGGVNAPQKKMMNMPLYAVLGFSTYNGLQACISFNRADSVERKGFSKKVNELAYQYNHRLFNKLIKPVNLY